MEIKTMVADGKATYALAGKMTVQTTSELKEAVEATPSDVCNIDIDLTDVDYVSSAGLRVFVAADRLTKERGGVLRLLNPTDDVHEVLAMTNLTDLLEIVR